MISRVGLLTTFVALAACVPIPGSGKPVAGPSLREEASLTTLLQLVAAAPAARSYTVSEQGRSPGPYVLGELEKRTALSFTYESDALARAKKGTALDVWTFDWTRPERVVVEGGYDAGNGVVSCRFVLQRGAEGTPLTVAPNNKRECNPR